MNTPQNRFRNHMRSLPVILGLCLVVAGCSQGAVEEEKPVELAPLAVETATVARKSITEFLEVDGSFVVPQGSDAKVSSVVAGRLLKVLVNEGDQVKAGQLLAVVDTKVLSAMSRGAKDAARVSGAMSLQAKLNYEGAVADQRASVQLAEQNLASAVAETDANVAIAKADLDKLKAGARPQEISQAEQAVAQAQISRDRAKLESDRDQQLLKEGFVSGQQAQSSKATLLLAESSLKQAQAQFELTKQGVRTEDLLSAEARYQSAKKLGDLKVSQAKVSLQQAQLSYKSVLAKAQEVRAAVLTETQRTDESNAADASAGYGEIRAPISGRIVKRNMGPGDSADPATPIFEIAASGKTVDFLASIEANEAQNVQQGMIVNFKSQPDSHGVVSSVGLPNPTTGLTPVRVMIQSASATKIGGFETARIQIRQLKNVIAVPAQSVVVRDGKEVVFLVKDGTAHMVEVEIGPEDSGFVAVTKGVAVGDQVILVSQHEIADGAKIASGKDDAKEGKEAAQDKKEK